MKSLQEIITTILIIVTLIAVPVSGVSADRKLIVGTKETAPFAMKNAEGEWSGISIELWEHIAEKLELQYEFREYDIDELLEGVQKNEIDIAIAAITLTSERESNVDFSHPYYFTGLGIAARSNDSRFLGHVRQLFSRGTIEIILSLALFLFAFGFIVWLFERKRNPEQFGGPVSSGLLSGFWWSAVTMTTVGYGDKAPQTTGGRIVALVWMFAGLIMISSFTAAITSQLTVSRLEDLIAGPEDLYHVRVGTVSGSTSQDYLEDRHIAHRTNETISDCLQALTEGKVDAVVYDDAILHYFINSDYSDVLEVLPETFEQQHYGVIMPQGSNLREKLNLILLELLVSSDYADIKFRYLGQ